MNHQTNLQRIRPGGWIYGFALLILVVGVVVFVISMKGTVTEFQESLIQVTVPGTTQIELENTGPHLLMLWPGPDPSNQAQPIVDFPPNLQLSITHTESGLQIPLSVFQGQAPPGTSAGGEDMIRMFEITQTGTHTLTGTYPPKAQGPQLTLAVFALMQFGFLSKALTGLGTLCISALLALAVLIFALIARGRSKRRLAQMASAGGQPTHLGGGSLQM